ncbi:AAA family ATPase [Pseudomonas viridiflava]|uniref:AAA family ATPase n=1 Tax=Pseudomonas viridiflava TaxID=33069 RepID=UPI0013CF29FD|nr:ATP-binding protein [Pseudomonas viridiflava]
MSNAVQLQSTDVKIGEIVGFDNDLWPFRSEGQLPDTIFSTEHIEHIIFVLWPTAFKCSATTIRAGLRSHVKKYAPQTAKKYDNNNPDHLRSLAVQFAFISQCRIKAKELTFFVERPAMRFGRSGTKSRCIEPKISFGELLGQGYSHDAEMGPLFEWFQDVAQPKRKNEQERYLTADLLIDGIKKGNCPTDPSSIEFARMVLIYSSVLNSLSEQIELVKAAMELGCLHLERLLKTRTTVRVAAADPTTILEAYSNQKLQSFIVKPALKLAGAAHNKVREAEPEIIASTNALIKAQFSFEGATETAKYWYGESTEGLINLNDEKWAQALSSIQNARATHKEIHKTRNIVSEQESRYWKEITKYLKRDIAVQSAEHIDDTQLIHAALEISKLGQALDELRPSFYQLQNWREENNDIVSIETLEKLVTSCEADLFNNLAAEEYRNEIAIYARNNGVSGIANLLPSLDSEHLGALIAPTSDHQWGIGEAIILRAAVEKNGTAPKSILAPLVNASPKRRRLLLSFIDAENSSTKTSIVLTRILAVERFRTVMLFEPIAQLLALTSTLMRVEVIGRTVYELADLLRTNATILGSSQDIARLLKYVPNNTEAYNALVSFSKTPATMQGNYRRLKEKAREALETRALRTAEINKLNIASFLSYIESGELASSVISELCAETDHKVETRHKEQLTRYIAQMEALLKDCISESQHRPDMRLKSLSAKIKKLHRQLRSSNDVGSIEWLEGEIADILEKPRREATLQYLTPIGSYTLESLWTSRETEFASQDFELPEFYYSTTVLFGDVAASCIYWQALNTLPSSLDIAKTLADNDHIKDAVAFSKERNDAAVSEYVREATIPICAQLVERADLIKRQFNGSLIEQMEEYALFTKALGMLDLSSATDALDLIELIAAEPATAADSSNRIHDRTANIKKRLLKFEGNHLSLNLHKAELELRWKTVLESNTKKRCHLTSVEKPFEHVDYLPPHLENLLAGFKDENEDPERWLDEDISSEFSDYVYKAAETLASWAKSAHIMINEEKNATYIICEWFIGFIAERALSIHQLDEASDLASAMDRIFEVSATILNATSPADCAIQLKDTGELPEHFVRAYESTAHDPVESRNLEKITEQKEVSDELQTNARLIELVKVENWAEALTLSSKHTFNHEDYDLPKIFTAFADISPKPNAPTIDCLQPAASWLSGSNELAAQLTESQRLSLAFLLLSGAIAADSDEEMPRVPSSSGGWAEILGRSSAFRKMLLGSIPFRVERILETLISGNLSLAIAERLWDAATNLNDPHLLRTPILSFMYEHGGSESICRLASRHDSVISTRLSQLFELRSVASARPDLIPVAQSVADQIVSAAKSVPFRNFIKELPTAAHAVKPNLAVYYEGDLCLHDSKKDAVFDLPIIVTPNGLVPAKLEAILFDGDDVYFEDNALRYELSNRPTYFASDFTLRIIFGLGWFVKGKSKDGVRIRIRAKTLTGELFSEDIIFRVRSIDPKAYGGTRLSNDTLLDLYPGVSNTPAVEETFIGRHDELELLNQVLVSAKRPSPVLLTGMRRIGKTSLLFAFHKRLKQPGNATAITFYLSLAERRVEFVAHERPVSATLFRAISHGLVRPNLSITDQNHAICSRIRQRFDGDWKQARVAIQECYDEESLSDSLIALSAKLIEWLGAPLERFVLLIDEAEALVAPYQAGGEKKLELEQLLQSLREVSQTTGSIGILLAGSNHINVFAREYKNAFFGSSQSIELTGLKDAKEAAALIAPKRVSIFIQFDPSAIEYAFSLCAGMPQFLWQVGATVAHMVRVGSATKRDVRLAIAALIGDNRVELPFKAYEILEPIDSILSLESARERDLLWMLLYRIASASSLVAEDATIPFVIDHALSALDDRNSWSRRLRALVDLKVLRMESPTTVRFLVPLFGEGFRAQKYWQEYNARLQGVAQ